MLTGVFSGDGPNEFESTRREIASENIIDGNILYARMDIKDILLSSIKRIKTTSTQFSGVRFYNIKEDKNFDHILKSIEGSMLHLGKVNFNDATDPLLVLFVKLKKTENKRKSSKSWFGLFKQECCDNLRIACLCVSEFESKPPLCHKKEKAFENQLMWSHYANSHTGIGIEYTIRPMDMSNYNNENTICICAPVHYSNKHKNIDNITIDDALLHKSQTWSYEKEYRIIYYSTDTKEDYIPIKVIINAVYLGVKISNKRENEICSKLKHIHIPIYKMMYNMDDIFHLTPKLIAGNPSIYRQIIAK